MGECRVRLSPPWLVDCSSRTAYDVPAEDGEGFGSSAYSGWCLEAGQLQHPLPALDDQALGDRESRDQWRVPGADRVGYLTNLVRFSI